jgi:hypothetical protein
MASGLSKKSRTRKPLICTFKDPCEMCAHRMAEGLTVEKVCGGQHGGPQVALWKRIEEAR